MTELADRDNRITLKHLLNTKYKVLRLESPTKEEELPRMLENKSKYKIIILTTTKTTTTTTTIIPPQDKI